MNFSFYSPFSQMKFRIHMWSDTVQDFIYEILIYEACIEYVYEMEDSRMEINFSYEIFFHMWNRNIFINEELFSYVKWLVKFLEGLFWLTWDDLAEG